MDVPDLTFIPVLGVGQVRPGDDLVTVLGSALAAQGIAVLPGDILVVTQKIVSKAEDRYVALRDVQVGDRAAELAAVTGKDKRLVQLVLDEASAVVRAAKDVLITRHRAGHVTANSGVDQSNSGSSDGDLALLLPADADASARSLREGFAERFGCAIGVVISDSFGRPWRIGTVGVALGASGVPALWDRRGEIDRDGRELKVTQVAIGDMLATAAALVMGEGAEGVPAVLVRGLKLPPGDVPASALIRPLEQDLFQ